MSKYVKLIISIYVLSLVLGAIFVNMHMQGQFNEFQISTEQVTRKFTIVKTTELNNQDLFKVMTDIQNYPKILPNNISKIKIINQTENNFGSKTIFAETEVVEAGVMITLLIKQEIFPLEKNIIEVIDGDAKGTTITQTFRQLNLGTEVTNEVTINVKGILTPFGFLPNYNFKHAFDSIFNSFLATQDLL